MKGSWTPGKKIKVLHSCNNNTLRHNMNFYINLFSLISDKTIPVGLLGVLIIGSSGHFKDRLVSFSNSFLLFLSLQETGRPWFAWHPYQELPHPPGTEVCVSLQSSCIISLYPLSLPHPFACWSHSLSLKENSSLCTMTYVLPLDRTHRISSYFIMFWLDVEKFEIPSVCLPSFLTPLRRHKLCLITYVTELMREE